MIGSDALDWVMDRTVVPGFSSVGYRLRRLDATSPDPNRSLRDRNIVITGASSGIGEAATKSFAQLGAHVHMVVRDLEKGEDVRARISERTGSDTLYVHRCDVSSLESVRTFAEALAAEIGDIAALVHNAGVLTKERLESDDGFELTLATHVLGPMLMTELLTPLLAEAASPRVIFVSSGGMYTERADVADPELKHRSFDGPGFYAHAKRLQVILAERFDERLDPLGISVHSMHPGWVDTPGVVDSLPGFHRITGPILRDPEQGADTIVWLAADDLPASPGQGGKLWMDRRERPAHRVPWTRESAEERQRLLDALSHMAHPEFMATTKETAAGA